MSTQATAAVPAPDVWRASQARRRWSGWLFYGLAVFSTLMGLVMLGALLFDIFTDGAREVDWHFLSNYPSRIADNAGLRSALLGSLWMLAFTAIIAFPLGVGAAIYLEEYAPDNWLTRFIQLNIANLAGVPSIVYGLLGLGLFVRWLALGRVVLAGSMTMALLILPLIIVASREAIRAVPDSLREGSYALGATRWQMVRQTVLALGRRRHPHRHHPRPRPRHRRNRAPHYHRRAHLRRLRSQRAPGHLHRAAHPDLQLGVAAPEGVPQPGGRRHRRPAGRASNRQFARRLSPVPHAEEASVINLRIDAQTTDAVATPSENGQTDAILMTRNLNFWYGSAYVLENVNCDVRPREVTAIIGPSGCGKSTFLRCFNRMNELIPTARLEGSVVFRNRDIYDRAVDPVEVRRQVGMVFQKPNPFPKSIYDNVAYGPRVNGYKGDMDEIVETSLKRAALWDEVKDDLKKSGLALSGGQQQRLCIARALAVQPDVLLMDEPCSALDPIATTRIEDLIRELREQLTIIIVTHNMQQAARISDRTAFFTVAESGAGVLVEFNDTQKLFTTPTDPRTEAYITGRFG